MWRRFIFVERKIGKIREMLFYLIFSFFRFKFKVVYKLTVSLFKGREDFQFFVVRCYRSVKDVEIADSCLDKKA